MTQKQLVSNKYVSWELDVKFRIEQHCLMKKRCILKNIFYQYLKCHAWRNLLFPYGLLIGPQSSFFECMVIFVKSSWSTLSRQPRLQESHCKNWCFHGDPLLYEVFTFVSFTFLLIGISFQGHLVAAILFCSRTAIYPFR